MAPFNTHFLIAEKVWPELQNGPWAEHYGQFCFGCVAPDVDKASATLSQRDTHFNDRTTDYELMASARTSAFMAQQAQFLKHPLAELPAAGQAFVLGYVCHLAVDEVSKHLWRQETWRKFKHVRPTSAFAVLDEFVWQQTENYEAIRHALAAIEALDVLNPVPLTDLQHMLRGVQTFVAARSLEQEYLALIDLFDADRSAEERQQSLDRLRQELDLVRPQLQYFKLEQLLCSGVAHSHRRLADLLAGRKPKPAYPELIGGA